MTILPVTLMTALCILLGLAATAAEGGRRSGEGERDGDARLEGN